MKCICKGNLVVYDKMQRNLNRFDVLELNDIYSLANILYKYRIIVMKAKDVKVKTFLYKFLSEVNERINLFYRILAKRDVSNELPKVLEYKYYTRKRYDDILIIKPLKTNLTEDEIIEEIINNKSGLIENFKISYYYVRGDQHG